MQDIDSDLEKRRKEEGPGHVRRKRKKENTDGRVRKSRKDFCKADLAASFAKKDELTFEHKTLELQQQKEQIEQQNN